MFKSFVQKTISVEAKQFLEVDYFDFWTKHPCNLRKLGQSKFYLPNFNGGDFVVDGDWIVGIEGKYYVKSNWLFRTTHEIKSKSKRQIDNG